METMSDGDSQYGARRPTLTAGMHLRQSDGAVRTDIVVDGVFRKTKNDDLSSVEFMKRRAVLRFCFRLSIAPVATVSETVNVQVDHAISTTTFHTHSNHDNTRTSRRRSSCFNIRTINRATPASWSRHCAIRTTDT